MSSDGHPNTPWQELSDSQHKHRIRYLIRCRRARFNLDNMADTELIRDVCQRESLDEMEVVHIGTPPFTELRVHTVFDYKNPAHHAVQICAFESKKWNKISVPPLMTTYLNNQVESWNSLRITGVKFPIREVVYPPSPKHTSYIWWLWTKLTIIVADVPQRIYLA
jgi:hypothetical protein